MKSKTEKTAAKSTALPKSIPPLLPLVCRVLDEKKAGDLKVLHVGGKSSITDFLAIATGTSEPHLRALRVELEKAIDASGERITGMETGAPGSGWLVIDAFDVMVHLFTRETRQRYSLEKLWSDASEIPVDALLGRAKPAPAKKKPAAARKAPAKKTASGRKKPVAGKHK